MTHEWGVLMMMVLSCAERMNRTRFDLPYLGDEIIAKLGASQHKSVATTFARFILKFKHHPASCSTATSVFSCKVLSICHQAPLVHEMTSPPTHCHHWSRKHFKNPTFCTVCFKHVVGSGKHGYPLLLTINIQQANTIPYYNFTPCLFSFYSTTPLLHHIITI